eukprot:1760832-Prymnesium_polylepis.1
MSPMLVPASAGGAPPGLSPGSAAPDVTGAWNELTLKTGGASTGSLIMLAASDAVPKRARSLDRIAFASASLRTMTLTTMSTRPDSVCTLASIAASTARLACTAMTP